MRNLIILFVKIIVVSIIIQGCNKYEDGPSFSLLSKKTRISNKWIENESLVNDVPVTFGSWINYRELLKDGTYSINIPKDSISTMNVIGSWEFQNSKEDIVLNLPEYTYRNGNYPAASDTFKILRLTKDELWLSKDINGSIVETRFVPY